MPTIQTKHAHAPQTELYYETYGQGRPVVPIHGWPLSGRMWEGQTDALRHAGLYGMQDLRSAMLVSSVAPYLLKTADNPDGGMTHEDVEGMVGQVAQNRPQLLAGFTKKFLNWDENGAKLGDEFLDFAASMYLQASPVATQECVRAFSETDFRADLAKLTVPTLVVHGDADQTVPLEASGGACRSTSRTRNCT